jgi:transglutaminase-like putative cysteine protease
MPLHGYSQTELVLTERKRLERPLMAMIWLSVLIFSLVQWDFFYLLAATLAVALNAYAAQKGKEVFVQRVFVNAGVLVATGILILEVVGRDRDMLLIALGHYFILILVCKLFEHKTNRDYVQMLALSMLLTVVPAIMCEKLWFAALLLTYVAIACYTAMVFTIKRGLDKAAHAVLAGEKASPGPGVIAWNTIHHWPGRSLWQWMGAIMFMIAAGAALTFIAFPRVATSAGAYQHNTSVSGFSESVQLGEKREIYLSKEVLMQVRLAYDAGGTGAVPESSAGPHFPPSAYYLRGRVFEEYRGNAWVHGFHRGSDISPMRRRVVPTDTTLPPPPARGTPGEGPSTRQPLVSPAVYPAREQGEDGYGQAAGAPEGDAHAAEPAAPATAPAAAHDRPARGNLVQDVALYPALGSATIFAAYPVSDIFSPQGKVETSPDLEATFRQAAPGDIIHYTAYSWTQPLTAEQRQYLHQKEQTPTAAVSPWQPDERPRGGPFGPNGRLWRRPPAGAPLGARLGTDGNRNVVHKDVLALAQEWCRDLLLARANDQDHRSHYDILIADRLAQRLGQRCAYSLDLSDANPDRDGVYDFLFYMKKGHCEYFASALTVMCRALDVRARLATGFHLDPSAGKGPYLVRGSDAHAWTEVYTTDTGWTIVDATPGGTSTMRKKTLWGSIEMFFSDLQYQWYDKVVGFDSSARDRLFNRIPKALAAIRDSIVNFFAYGAADTVFVAFVIVVLTAGLLVEGICVYRLVRKTKRYRQQMRGAGLVSPVHVGFARSLAKLLHALAPKEPAATPREIVGRACSPETPQSGQPLPDDPNAGAAAAQAVSRPYLPDNLRPELADLVELYYKIRWGKLIATKDQMLAAADKLRMLKRSIVKR